MGTAPPCRTVTVHTFRGDRTGAFRRHVFRALDDERAGRGPGPSTVDCLLLTGHTGVSIDTDQAIYGFNPDTGQRPAWQVMQQLRSGDAFPGVVRDDAQVFAAASAQGLKVLRIDVILPEPGFQVFQALLTDERKQSRYRYGFPDGDGDCNCTTWLERLTLPLLSGSMEEFTALSGFVYFPKRRFGRCQYGERRVVTVRRTRQKRIPPEAMLSILAMRFRSTRDEVAREAITTEYATVVMRLIASGKWKDMPTFEDMLPDERLPKAFFDYWEIPCPHERNGTSKGERADPA